MIPPFQIASGPRVRFGRGEVSAIGEEVKALGMKKPLLITDSGLAGTGVLNPLLDGLKAAGVDFAYFDRAEPNPSDASIEKARDFYGDNGCDGMIAAGGGSSMDTAKASMGIIAMGGVPRDIYGFGKVTKTPPPLITVPTTAGTGSEVTLSAIVTDAKLKIKAVLASPGLFAKVTIVDPGLLAGLPPHMAAGTMLDALTHAIEAMGSPKANPWTDALCYQAIEYIGRYGRAFVKDRANPTAADRISISSTWAGYAFTNVGLGIVHSLAHPIGAYHNAHHGTVNGIFLPHVMAYNLPAMEEKYARIAPMLQNPERPQTIPSDPKGAAEAAGGLVRDLCRDLDLPITLKEVDVTLEHIDVMAKDAAESPQAFTNPVPANEAEMKDLFLQAME